MIFFHQPISSKNLQYFWKFNENDLKIDPIYKSSKTFTFFSLFLSKKIYILNNMSLNMLGIRPLANG